MDIIAETSEFYIEKETAVAIGKFDGIHLGHRRLMDEILALKERGLTACVFTFDPPPSVLFGGDNVMLSTRDEKRRMFETMGIDILVEFPMNKETAATPPERFISDYLVKQMNTKYIVAGTDISFGDKGMGNAQLLEKLADRYGYKVKLIDKVTISGGEEISSSLVRRCVESGDMEKVKELLGSDYCVSGEIVHGNALGHTLGFPTINIYPDENKQLPPNGVYTSVCFIEGKWYNSVSNVGRKPTVGGEVRTGVESYLYDFDGDLYGKFANIYLEKFCRPEQKFANIDALKAQLQLDIAYSKR